MCRRYLDGSESVTGLTQEINVCITTVQRWIRIFQAYGDSAFDEKPANELYTKEFKRKAVEAYLAGDGSLRDIAVKYKIPACGTVLVWVKLYSDYIELKDKRGIRSGNKRMGKTLQL
uniref:transposase n=1 Tax=Coprobacillus sp. K06 TaxID=2718930 RepID=UPI003369C8B6